MDNWLQVERNVVLVCSVKSDYRHLLCVDSEQVKLVYLKGSFDLIAQRLEHRQNNFMKIEMLKSQFDTLEEPETGIHVELSKPPEEILQQIRLKLGI